MNMDVLTNLKNVVETRVMLPRKRARRVTVRQRMLENIRIQRQLLNGNLDAFYTFTLIEKTKESIKKLNLKDMTPEALDMFSREIRDMIMISTQVIYDTAYEAECTSSEHKETSNRNEIS